MTDRMCDYCERDDAPVYLADGSQDWYACATCEADLQMGVDRIMAFGKKVAKSKKLMRLLEKLEHKAEWALMQFVAGHDVLIDDLAPVPSKLMAAAQGRVTKPE